MKYAQIIFSPTGGTEKVAKAIAKNWESSVTIDLSAADDDYTKYIFCPEDIVLIAMPSFGGLAPQIAVERLGRIKGGSARCVLAAVYGNRAYEDTLVQMEDAAVKCGFRVIAAVAAIAEHSIMHQYAAGRPNSADYDTLESFGAAIDGKIKSGVVTKLSVPGNRPYKKSSGVPLVPKTGPVCTKCGLCAEKCPVGAIDPKSPKMVDGKKCIACMRCVSICPQKAKKVNSIMVSAVALAIKKACSEPKQNELFI